MRENTKKQISDTEKLIRGIGVIAVLIFVLWLLFSGGSGDATDDTPSVSQAQIANALEEVMTVIDDANTAADLRFFDGAAIRERGERLEVTVTDVWYQLPQYQKERLVESVADRYANIAAVHGLRGEKAEASNYPTTAFVDAFGKEVAYKNTFRTRVNP